MLSVPTLVKLQQKKSLKILRTSNNGTHDFNVGF